MSDDLTVKILVEIRDELRKTNLRIDVTNERLDKGLADVRGEIAELRAEMHSELAEVRAQINGVEMRQATRTIEQTAATRGLYDMLTGQLDLRDRVERCEHDISVLKERADAG